MIKPFFLVILAIFFLVSSVHAVTVGPSRYSSTLSAGTSDTFVMTMKPDTPAEQGLQLVNAMDAGNCSDWITLDKQGMKLVSGITPVTASIHVPDDATNGLHRCYAMFTAPTVNQIQYRISVPFSITVKGGIEPTIAPVLVTSTTTSITEAPIMKAPVQEQIVPVLVPGVASVQRVSGPAPTIPYLWIVGGILATAFIITLVYDWRRKK